MHRGPVEDAPTAARPSLDPANLSRSVSEMPVALVHGSGPHFSAETSSLLRSRLRAAVAFFVLVAGVFLVRKLFLPVPVLLWPHVALFVALAALWVLLRSGRCLGRGELRAAELAIFGLTSLYAAAVQHAMVSGAAAADDALAAGVAIKSAVVFFLAIMVAYGMFIPNHWRRAVRVVTPMALLPMLVNYAAMRVDSDVGGVLADVATPTEVSANGLMLLTGAGLAVFGTHVINSLRREAHQARRYGQYVLREQIGAGGMGEVYLAEHRMLKRPAAMKLIRPEMHADATAIARFEREVRVTADLKHWNTVDIYDYGRTEDGIFYYVMEYLEGKSLADLIKDHGPLDPARVIHLMWQACAALREAHARGLIHRDIKPGNLHVTALGGVRDVLKVLDFGLVKFRSSAGAELTQQGLVLGSPQCMAPEQATGDLEMDGRSDIYALGCVMYLMLTGRPPFVADEPLKVLIAHVKDPVVPPSRLRAGIPEDLEGVILRCLEKDPAARYPDVVTLSRALGGCAAAGQWTEEQAEAWWQGVDAEARST